jgi:hypothetical protein
MVFNTQNTFFILGYYPHFGVKDGKVERPDMSLANFTDFDYLQPGRTFIWGRP